MDSKDELREMLGRRVADAKEIRRLLDQELYKNLDGRNAIIAKVAAEEKFLEKFSSPKPRQLERKFFETSNLIHLLNLVNEIQRQSGVIAVMKTFALKNLDREFDKLKVDIVADNGKKWVKVVSRSAKGIVADWFPGKDRDIFSTAKDYLGMAGALKQVDLPKICFIFCAGITDKMAGKLERMGLLVEGERIPQDDIKKLPPEFEAELEQDDEEFFVKEEEEKLLVNLDVSAVFVLISNLTHPGGCDKILITKLLTDQATEEKIVKARELLLQEIGDKEMIICQTAFNSVTDILATVAGPTERSRAENLFKNVRIVKDNISERADNLEATERISDRCKIIFGTGDTHKAITATANKHCISSAISQGVSFDVILHPSRALSEKKEEGYTGPR